MRAMFTNYKKKFISAGVEKLVFERAVLAEISEINNRKTTEFLYSGDFEVLDLIGNAIYDDLVEGFVYFILEEPDISLAHYTKLLQECTFYLYQNSIYQVCKDALSELECETDFNFENNVLIPAIPNKIKDLENELKIENVSFWKKLAGKKYLNELKEKYIIDFLIKQSALEAEEEKAEIKAEVKVKKKEQLQSKI
jgi:hypothetical protein